MEEFFAPSTPESAPNYKITVAGGCLRAELHNRATLEDLEAFLMTVAATSKVLEHGRVLITVDSDSRILTLLRKPVFSTYLNGLWESPSHKVAVLGEHTEPSAHVESFTRHTGFNVRSFEDESAALKWVRDQRAGYDRRRILRVDYPGDRRRLQRRTVAGEGTDISSDRG